ncbi:DAHP synthetase [Meira miltonrushii]|uniref:Phospho-2-dehydro-3-deoxyheptonate aldolase n=1 Tax=Meira miltonrushii TaxID=1280837 RepID=A0A316VB78_9BASI|nr:DAHP synthetase [Meira miltonrushii]PWN32815.1 DAHP synthetase [Meira miltonrushii]
MASSSDAGQRPAWTPSSWRKYPISQPIEYPSRKALEDATQQLRSLPGLVTSHEIRSLRAQLASVAQGKSFLLQGGDCAELFADCTPDKIEGKVKLLLLMSLIIIWGARIPVVRVGRIAGQYAKPRSKATEVVDVPSSKPDGSITTEKKEVLTFRGDNINGFAADQRIPDPQRLLTAYFYSCTTLNHIRASLGSGLADLHAPLSWTTSHVRSESLAKQFSHIVSSLTDALDFMRVIGAESQNDTVSKLETVDYFIAHECLTLEFEEAMTRQTVNAKKQESAASTPEAASPPFYDLSAHFVWLGDRTRAVNEAHAEFVRGIANPIGIKVGPSMKPDELISLLSIVDPSRGADLGKVTLIARFGRGKSQTHLPALIKAIQSSPWSKSVIWCCDPMHGNTISSPSDPSLKTRAFGDVLTELTEQLAIHAQNNSHLGGIHLELTGEVDEYGESVTECTGGAMGLEDSHLKMRYRTHCDPRLNLEQSLDIAFMISNALKSERLNAGASSSAKSATEKYDHDALVKELLNGTSTL